MKTTMIRK